MYNLQNHPFLSLWRYAAGQESMPFQARVLMAWVMRALAHNPGFVHLTSHLPAPSNDPYRAVQLITSFAALFGAIAFTRGSLRLLTRDSNFSRWASLLVAFMVYFNLPLIYGLSYTLPYDLPSLFFFAGCLYCIVRRSYLGLYPLFVLGTFNRETICFVTVFFVIWEISRPVLRIAPIVGHAVVQTALWIGIKIYLGHLFAANPHEQGASGLMVPHLHYNLHEVLKPQQWPLLLSNFGFTLPLLIVQRRRIQNPGIARACAVMLPLWFALMFYVGVIIEIRIYTELIALMALAIGLIVFHSRSAAQEAQQSVT